ncbi:McrC family protein [Salinicoccus jeotgali]|uniref:McrC family protein n=1 Tax=Salinicoccus jeotgali TaxID=381634 RepID=A0ABP7ENR6_9STAP
MKTKDNTMTTSADVSISKAFIDKIANKDIEELETSNLFLFPPKVSESDDLDASRFVMMANTDDIRTTNVMGVIGYKNERLFIGSRFDSENDYFFYYMLKKVLNMNVIDTEVNMQAQNGFLELLIPLFPKFLNNAMKKGLYKEYKVHHHNDTNIKGAIDFKRHLKKNTPFLGKVAYNTREFSYENHMIHLIRYTIEFIKRRRDLRKVLYMNDTTKENIRVIEENSLQFDSEHMSKIIHQNIRKPIRHGYFFEYQALQRLCIAILRIQSSHFRKHSNNEVYGILFDGAWLFEEYVNTIIGDQFLHPQNTKGLGRHYLFNAGNGLIYPDFISRNEMQPRVADAKYKPNRNIHGRDYLQLVAYMYRFEAAEGYFIYPFQETLNNNEDKTLSLLSGIEKASIREPRINIIKSGIRIPSQARDFKNFEENMMEEEVKLRNRIITPIPSI